MSTTSSDLAPVLADVELDPAAVTVLERAYAGTSGLDPVREAVGRGPVLLEISGAPTPETLATMRDALWPAAHVVAVYRTDGQGGLDRQTLSGTTRLPARLDGPPRTVLFVHSRADALGRKNTVAKFDANAEGWNGVPGSPTYGHFRWMRKLLADVAAPMQGLRVLDAGCGAGWVGIEAALQGADAAAFDPSPAMVEIAKRNAAENGVGLDARVGFVEDVPFDEPFDLVLNSGVISFAPESGVYIERLDALLRPGGTLVIGDLNPESRGFSRRRRRPLLPARELNGLRRDEVEALLTERGYTVEGRWYYQLTFPIPELMALSEQRLGGFGCRLALAANQSATRKDHARGSPGARRFDSWILRATKPA